MSAFVEYGVDVPFEQEQRLVRKYVGDARRVIRAPRRDGPRVRLEDGVTMEIFYP